MNKIWILFIVVLSFAQIQTSGSISVRMGDGINYEMSDTSEYDYFESIGDLNFYRGNVRGWLEYEWSTEPEIGFPTDAIRKRALVYENNFLIAELGDFYPILGRGLALNSIDDQSQDWDSGLDGFHVNLRENQHNIGVLAGKMEFHPYSPAGSLRLPSNIEHYKIRGAYFSSQTNLFDMGIHYLHTKTPQTQSGFNTIWSENLLTGGFLSAVSGNIDFYLEPLWKSSDSITRDYENIETRKKSKGFGIYSTISAYFSKFSMVAEYKNYQFDVVDPEERLQFARDSRVLPFQNPPTCVKELGSQLLSRISHPTDFNDEVGGQILLTTMLSNDWLVNFSGAIASRTAIWNGVETEHAERWVPSLTEKADPYFEIMTEINGYIRDLSVSTIIALNQQTIFSAATEEFERETDWTIPLTLTLPTSFGNIFTSTEFQHVEKENFPEYGVETVKYFNVVANLAVSFQPTFSFGVSSEWTNEPLDESEKKWLQFDASVRIHDAYLLQIMVGSERGGIKCTNGICRKYPPFNGLRIAFSGQF